MGTFELARTLPGTPAEVFAVVADLHAYGEFVPMTRIDGDPGPIGPGWRFDARTGPGPLALLDRMQVTHYDAPHGFGIVKLGPILDGWAEIDLTAEGEHTRVIWREHITVRPAAVGRLVAPLTDPVNRLLFGRALDKMTARLINR